MTLDAASTSRASYFQLLDKYSDCGVAIFAESRNLWAKPLPYYIRTPEEQYRARVHLERPVGGHRVWPTAEPATAVKREVLFRGAADIARETCELAHELGHHHSTFDGYEAIMERYHLDVRLVSRNEWLQVCAEEQFAWDWARSYLSQIGFNEVALFERFAAESLDTYAKSLREASS